MVLGTFLAQYFSESCTAEITTQIPLLIGGVIAYIGRYTKGDITPLGFRKQV